MFKNNLQTINRVSKDLEDAILDNENLPEWCQEKIAEVKALMVNVMDYMISDKEIEVEKETGEEGYVSEQNVWEDIDVDIHVEESFDLQEDVIDEEVRSLIDRNYARSEQILKDHLTILHLVHIHQSVHNTYNTPTEHISLLN
mgnify:CR=1 FL=1